MTSEALLKPAAFKIDSNATEAFIGMILRLFMNSKTWWKFNLKIGDELKWYRESFWIFYLSSSKGKKLFNLKNWNFLHFHQKHFLNWLFYKENDFVDIHEKKLSKSFLKKIKLRILFEFCKLNLFPWKKLFWARSTWDFLRKLETEFIFIKKSFELICRTFHIGVSIETFCLPSSLFAKTFLIDPKFNLSIPSRSFPWWLWQNKQSFPLL